MGETTFAKAIIIKAIDEKQEWGEVFQDHSGNNEGRLDIPCRYWEDWGDYSEYC